MIGDSVIGSAAPPIVGFRLQNLNDSTSPWQVSPHEVDHGIHVAASKTFHLVLQSSANAVDIDITETGEVRRFDDVRHRPPPVTSGQRARFGTASRSAAPASHRNRAPPSWRTSSTTPPRADLHGIGSKLHHIEFARADDVSRFIGNGRRARRDHRARPRTYPQSSGRSIRWNPSAPRIVEVKPIAGDAITLQRRASASAISPMP